MFKYFVVFVIVAVVALFYPYRDLYVREHPFADGYTLVGKGYWTRQACREAALAQAAEDFQCRERTLFGSMISTSSRYSQSGQPQAPSR